MLKRKFQMTSTKTEPNTVHISNEEEEVFIRIMFGSWSIFSCPSSIYPFFPHQNVTKWTQPSINRLYHPLSSMASNHTDRSSSTWGPVDGKESIHSDYLFYYFAMTFLLFAYNSITRQQTHPSIVDKSGWNKSEDIDDFAAKCILSHT